ncbi:MAG: hypothetical protein ABI690_11465 [Chloroflexota bacterium]
MMKSMWVTFLYVTVLLVLAVVPVEAADSAACSAINGWTGYLVHSGPTVAEKTLPGSFKPGEKVTIGLSGFEAGVTIEIPAGNVVAQYPYFLGYLSETFTYTIPGNGVNSVRITLAGYDLTFHASCGNPSKASGHLARPAEPPDKRLNWQHGDLLAAIYPSTDEQGKPALDVYNVTQQSEGYFACRIAQADLAATPPAQNTLIKQCSAIVSVYQLATGEVQFNIGPDAEGKTIVVILDGIPSSKIYGYNFQV